METFHFYLKSTAGDEWFLAELGEDGHAQEDRAPSPMEWMACEHLYSFQGQGLGISINNNLLGLFFYCSVSLALIEESYSFQDI